MKKRHGTSIWPFLENIPDVYMVVLRHGVCVCVCVLCTAMETIKRPLENCGFLDLLDFFRMGLSKMIIFVLFNKCLISFLPKFKSTYCHPEH